MPLPAMASDPKQAVSGADEAKQFFEQKVMPVLQQHCLKCHSEERQRGGLRLDTRADMLVGGDSGPSIVPGKPDESLLVEAINWDSYEMPPGGKMNDDEIAILTKWVAQGAVWPGSEGEEASTVKKKAKITDEDRAFWSFQPIVDPKVPAPKDGGWSLNPIDRFVFERLKAEGMAPAPTADRRTLIRRATYDLHGVPPTPEEVEAFVSDPDPKAYEKLVDRLLASPRYGERWARHWLDLVRYAESDGWRADHYRPNAWRYRDYVINSFNADKPYDKFVAEQLAGDEIAPEDPEAMMATGYLRHFTYEYNQRDARGQWANILNDITDVTGDVFLGMGVGCARCHDHKFDPILQEDYFRLQAFFAPVVPYDVDLPRVKKDEKTEQRIAEIEKTLAEIDGKAREGAAKRAVGRFPEELQAVWAKPEEAKTPLDKQMCYMMNNQVIFEYDRIENSLKKSPRLEEYKKLKAELAKLKGPNPGSIMAIRDVANEAPEVLIPGKKDAEPIQPGYLSVLDPATASLLPPPNDHTTGRRTTLAKWITDPTNPLAPRVMTNRIWQYHFGRGLVGSASDFGRLGDKPSHPQLLDWLSSRFIESDWSIKKMHRMIMLSATYQQSTKPVELELSLRKDPENRLLWRMNPRRLDAEEARDAMLVVSGELQEQMGGPAVDGNSPRRSIYTRIKRNNRDAVLDAFDAPDAFSSCAFRHKTTTSTQALLMINGPWPMARAKKLADRIQGTSADEKVMITKAYKLVYGRTPSAKEMTAAQRFLADQRKLLAPVPTKPVAPLGTLSTADGPLKALSVRDANLQDRVGLKDTSKIPTGDFTIEAIVNLKSLFPSANVRTIAAWNGLTNETGWAFGVTSEKSSYQPSNLILQMMTDGPSSDPKKKVNYIVIPSDLRVPLNRPVYVAASVHREADGQTNVTFFMQDLSKKNAPLMSSYTANKLVGSYKASKSFLIGGREGTTPHGWDGLIGEVRLTGEALQPGNLLVGPKAKKATDAKTVVGHWMFESAKQPLADASGKGLDVSPMADDSDASGSEETVIVDFSHVLLNSNEFLFLD